MAVLVEISPLNPATGTRVRLGLAGADDRRITAMNGLRWWPGVVQPPSFSLEGWDGDFSGSVVYASGTLQVDPVALARNDQASPSYRWPGAPVTIWEGQPGAPWSSWRRRFVGLLEDYSTDESGRYSFTAKVDSEPFEGELMTLVYTGGGGIEGPVDLKDKPKPMLLGYARNVEPVLIDSVNNVFQVHSYGPIEQIVAVYERAADFVANGGAYVGDFATYDALVAADIVEGDWGSCNAHGLFRLGAPPAGLITADVKGDNASGFVRSTAAVIQRLCELRGVPAERIDFASLTKLENEVPYPINLYLTGSTKLIDMIRSLALPCNSQALVDWSGKLHVIRFGSVGFPTFTLDGQGRARPPVQSIVELKTSPPYGRIEMRGARAWRVHSADETAFAAPIVPLGDYDPTRTYKTGNQVSMPDGSSWVWIAEQPGSGITPGTDPTKWERVQSPVSVISPGTIIGGTYNPVTGEIDGGVPAEHIVDLIGQVGEIIDTTPPDIPDGLTLGSTVQIDSATGLPRIVMIASSDPATATDVSVYEFEITRQSDQALVMGSPIPRIEVTALANTLYTARVRSVDRIGNRSGWSDPVQHTTAKDTVAPAPPHDGVITGGYTSIFASWTNPADADLAKIEVYMNVVDDFASAVLFSTIAATPGKFGSLTRTGLPNNTTVHLWVVAVDTSGNASTPYHVGSATTAKVPTADLAGQIQGAQIAAAAIDKTKMAAGLSVPEVVSALPNSGNFQGRLVYLTTSGKLYRWTSTGSTGTASWTVAVDGGDIVPATIDLTKFVSGMAPIERVSSLPSAGNFRGRVVMLTSDGKLYRWNSDTTTGTASWDKSTDGADILANSVTASQIAAGSISVDKLAVGSKQSLLSNMTDVWDFWRGDFPVGSGGATANPNLTWNQSAGILNNYWAYGLSPIGTGGELLMQLISVSGEAPAGGWNMSFPESYGFSKLKSYRFMTWVFVPSQPAAAAVYFGCENAAQTVDNGGGTASNPYFFSFNTDLVPRDRWLLMVGVVHGSESQTGQTGLSGLYDPVNGKRFGTAVDYRWRSDATFGMLRAYQFYPSAANARVYFSKPVIEEIVPGMTSIQAYMQQLDPAAQINSGTTTINGGQLTTGTVTAEKIVVGALSRNMVPNSRGAQANTSGWYLTQEFGSGTASLNYVANWILTGKPGFSIVKSSTSFGSGYCTSTLPVEPGKTYVVRGRFYGSSATSSGLYVRLYQKSGYANPITASNQDTYTDLYVGAWPSDGTNPQGGTLLEWTWTCPSGTNWASLNILNWVDGPVEGYFTDVEFFEQNTAVTIADGAITAPKIAAASITGDKILAGTITGGLIAANTLTADKLVVGTKGQNLIPNPTGAAGTIDGWAYVEGAVPPDATLYVIDFYTAGRKGFMLAKANTSVATAVGTVAMPVVPGKTYVLRTKIGSNVSTASGLYLRVNWAATRPADGIINGANRTGSADWIGNGPIDSNTIASYEFVWTVPTGANWISIAVYNWTNGPTQLYFADVEFFEQTTSAVIADGAVVANKIAASAVTADKIGANQITGTHIVGGTITGDKVAAGTLSAGHIAVGSLTGDRLAASTIAGDRIAANTITADKLTIGTRGLNVIDVTFQVAVNGASLSWTAGYIQFYDNNGNFQQVSVSAGSTSLANYVYIYWVQGSTTLSATNTAVAAFGPTTVCIATWQAGSKVITQIYGSTIIDGSRITTGTVTATQIAAGTITGDRIAGGTVTADKIGVAQLSAITANLGTMTATAPDGSTTTVSGFGMVQRYPGGAVAVAIGNLTQLGVV